MIKRIFNSFSGIIGDDLKASRLLFLLVSIAFIAFGLFAANVPMRGFIPHRLLNFLSGSITLVFLLAITFSQRGIRNREKLVIAFIYFINVMDAYLLYTTEHMDMYAYQFIITYVVSSYFFTTKKSLKYFVIIINTLVVATAFTSHAKTNAPLDFYMTYIVSQGVFVLLFRYRFDVEERLLESEKKYRLLAENSFDLICIHQANAKMEFVSPSVKRLLGYDPEELIGKYPISMVHPEDAHIMKGLNFSDPAHPFMAKPVQFRLRNGKGEYIWFETIFTLMDEPDGTGIVLSQSRDIRRSKKYQLELEERSSELERSNADLETFAFVSSHDMQEPLRMISNYTQLLKKRYAGKLDKEANEYLDFAHNGAVNLQQLIHDLLSYSRIHRSELKKTTVNVSAILDELLKNVRLEIEEKKAEVLYGDLCKLEADPNHIKLLMQNLILNGIKYNQSQNPEVRITSENKEKEVVFCVADNGIGIDEKYQQRIFEPFHRLHTKAEYPGTGLGLSICKKIVDRQGGKMWIESEPEKGSKFFFSLPLN